MAIGVCVAGRCIGALRQGGHYSGVVQWGGQGVIAGCCGRVGTRAGQYGAVGRVL